MNWTASLLRNELKKQKEAYESRLNLLTEASLDVQNYFKGPFEEKLKETEESLKQNEQNLTDLKNHAENTQKDQAQSLEEKASPKLEKKITASKELIFNLKKEIRTNQLYSQQQLRKVSEDYQTKLKEQTKQLKAELALLSSSETDQREYWKKRPLKKGGKIKKFELLDQNQKKRKNPD